MKLNDLNLTQPLPLATFEWRTQILRNHYQIIKSRKLTGNGRLPGTLSLLELDTLGITFSPHYINTLPCLESITSSVLADRITFNTDIETSNINQGHFNLTISTEKLVLEYLEASLILNAIRTYLHSNALHFEIRGLDAFVLPGDVVSSRIDGSGFWHRDSTGTQVKVFIGIYRCGSGVTTQYITRSHTRQPICEQWEMIRTLRDKNLSYLNQFNDYLSDANSNDVISRSLGYGDIMIFDTNGTHRGVYFLPGSRDDFQDRRIVICATFCNPTNHELFCKLNGQSKLWPLA
jgi:hypothetical protein